MLQPIYEHLETVYSLECLPINIGNEIDDSNSSSHKLKNKSSLFYGNGVMRVRSDESRTHSQKFELYY